MNVTIRSRLVAGSGGRVGVNIRNRISGKPEAAKEGGTNR